MCSRLSRGARFTREVWPREIARIFAHAFCRGRAHEKAYSQVCWAVVNDRHLAMNIRDRNDSRVKRSWTCAMWYWLAWCLVLESAVLVTRAADLLPYDTHQQLPVGNEEAAQIPLTTPFVFLEQNYSALTVSHHLKIKERQQLNCTKI